MSALHVNFIQAILNSVIHIRNTNSGSVDFLERSIILIICIGLLFAMKPVSCQEEYGSISFEQSGVSKNYYNYNDSITYNISVNNEIGHPMRYTVALEVGSDIGDNNTLCSREKSIDIPAGSSRYVTFPIDFSSRSLCRGKFAEWALDGKNTSKWDHTWYNVSIEPLAGQDPLSFSGDNYSSPCLVHTIWMYEGARVSPSKGTNDDYYDYQISLFSSEDDAVTLEVAPSKNGPWIDCGNKNYNLIDSYRILEWEDVKLDFDFDVAYYRFVGSKSRTETFEGPRWFTYYDYRNPSVDPDVGYHNSVFDYSLDIIANKELDVELRVEDVDQNDFRSVGNISYDNISNWQTLKWSNIQLQKGIISKGISHYYFCFYDNDMLLNTTVDKDNKFYTGPEILWIKFENPVVVQQYDKFHVYNYAIDIVAPNNTKCNVMLQTSSPECSKWMNHSKLKYNESKTLNWNDIRLNDVGPTDYRFVGIFGKICVSSENYTGPTLEPININGRVEPSCGSFLDDICVKYQNNTYDGTYVYCAEIERVEDYNLNWIRLEICDPISGAWIPVTSDDSNMLKHCNSSDECIVFIVNMDDVQFKETPFLGTLKYRFITNVGNFGPFEGPEINVNFKNEDYSRRSRIYDYVVTVRSSQGNLPIDIIYTNDASTSNEQRWFQADDIRTYHSNNSEWEVLVWKNCPMYREVHFIAVSD